MRKALFDFSNDSLDYTVFNRGDGDSALGLIHPRGLDLRPDLPLTTHELIGIDLTHRIDYDDIAYAKGGPGGGGGGGSTGGTSFPIYISGPTDAAAGRSEEHTSELQSL